MTGRTIVVLFISLVLADFANSIPKLERRPARKDKPGKRWARQGLPASVEDPDLQQNGLTTPQDIAAENDPGLDAENEAPPDGDLDQENNGNLEENPQNEDPQDENPQNEDPKDENPQNEDLQEENPQNEDPKDENPQNEDPKDENPQNEDPQDENPQNEEPQNDDPIDYEEGPNEGQDDNMEQPETPNENEFDADLGNGNGIPPEELPSQLKQQFENMPFDTRALQAGDIFTAQEMLPIAMKLMAKVPRIGKGKGIISSALNPKMLADTLFERFFVISKRIIVLEASDIPGLDAFQALALSGEVAGMRSSGNSITESPANERGEHLAEENPIRKCHYKFLRKRVYGNRKGKNVKRRQRVNLAKKLGKNRKVVVNPARRGTARKNKISSRIKIGLRQSKKTNITISNRGPIKQNQKRIARGNYKKDLVRIKKVEPKLENNCRWKYECRDPFILETCRLHTDCSEEAKSGRKYLGVKVSYDENTEEIKNFRRDIGVDVIDEEVEKILEVRYKTLRLQKPRTDKNIESLADYFNKIVLRDFEAVYSSPHPLVANFDLDGSSMVTESYHAKTTEEKFSVPDDPRDILEDTEMPDGAMVPPNDKDPEAADDTINDEVMPAPEDPGAADEGINDEDPGAADDTVNDEVVPAPEDPGTADDTVNDEVMQAPEDAGTVDEAIMPPTEDGENEAVRVLEAKRRILPGILKKNNTRVLPINF